MASATPRCPALGLSHSQWTPLKLPRLKVSDLGPQPDHVSIQHVPPEPMYWDHEALPVCAKQRASCVGPGKPRKTYAYWSSPSYMQGLHILYCIHSTRIDLPGAPEVMDSSSCHILMDSCQDLGWGQHIRDNFLRKNINLPSEFQDPGWIEGSSWDWDWREMGLSSDWWH